PPRPPHQAAGGHARTLEVAPVHLAPLRSTAAPLLELAGADARLLLPAWGVLGAIRRGQFRFQVHRCGRRIGTGDRLVERQLPASALDKRLLLVEPQAVALDDRRKLLDVGR